MACSPLSCEIASFVTNYTIDPWVNLIPRHAHTQTHMCWGGGSDHIGLSSRYVFSHTVTHTVNSMVKGSVLWLHSNSKTKYRHSGFQFAELNPAKVSGKLMRDVVSADTVDLSMSCSLTDESKQVLMSIKGRAWPSAPSSQQQQQNRLWGGKFAMTRSRKTVAQTNQPSLTSVCEENTCPWIILCRDK